MRTLGIEFLVRNPAYHATCLHFKCQVRTLSENKFKFHNVFFKVVHSVRHFFFLLRKYLTWMPWSSCYHLQSFWVYLVVLETLSKEKSSNHCKLLEYKLQHSDWEDFFSLQKLLMWDKGLCILFPKPLLDYNSILTLVLRFCYILSITCAIYTVMACFVLR